MFYVSFFQGDKLSTIFTSDPEVIAAAASYLKAYAFDCILTSFLFCFSGYFNGCGKTMFNMAQGVLGAFCVRIPVSYFVSRIAGVPLFYIGLATPCSTIVQIVLCLIYFMITENKKRVGALE